MQVPLFAGTAHVTFTIADVIDPIMPAPTLEANGPKVVFRGQEAEFRTARGVAPLTRIRGAWYLQVLINNTRRYLLVDWQAPGHVWPVGCTRQKKSQATELAGKMLESSLVTKQTGAAGRTYNASMAAERGQISVELVTSVGNRERRSRGD